MGDCVPADLAERVSHAVAEWSAWVPDWRPPLHRGRSRVCRRCTGSPVLAAAGLSRAVPHQVSHALTVRIERIVEEAVDRFTEADLPLLHAELLGEQLWSPSRFSPHAGLPPELDGLDLDPEPEDGQPYLFTLAELAADLGPEEAVLPRPPLTEAEKHALRREIEQADLCADAVGREVCFVLLQHQTHISQTIARFVEPQIQALLDTLSLALDSPNEL